MVKSKASRIVVFVILLMVTMVFIIPLIWTFLTSIKVDKEIYSSSMVIFPSQIYFGNYVKLLTHTRNFIMQFYNTVFITFFSVLATVILSAMMGYTFGVLKFAGKKFYFTFIMLIITLPQAIYLIPIYIMESNVDILNTHLGLILPYVAINLPMSVLIMRGIFKNIPGELNESAAIDGCNFIQVWTRIMMPIAKPGNAIIIIFTFINVWGEFMFARTLTSTPDAQTLSVGVTFLRDEAASWQYGTLCTAIVVTFIPLLAIFLAMQRYFIQGITEGALKG